MEMEPFFRELGKVLHGGSDEDGGCGHVGAGCVTVTSCGDSVDEACRPRGLPSDTVIID
jgi:hypothetical protein